MICMVTVCRDDDDNDSDIDDALMFQRVKIWF